MDKVTDNANNTETNTQVSKPVETVEVKKKPKRKFEWTPKRKAAFEKCVAARKNQIQTKPKNSKMEQSTSSDSDLSSSSSEEYRKPKRRGLKKQFHKLKKDLLYNMNKKLRHNDYYDNYDNEDEYPSTTSNLPTRQSVSESPQTNLPPPVPQQQERQKPKYCFV
jgi:hypothetical protein